MNASLSSLLRARGGASAAEFALVVPLLTLFLLGIIDTGRFMWEYNRAEKATQIGARMAIVTTALPSGLIDKSYVGEPSGSTTLKAGDAIPASLLGTILCTSTGCICEATPCPPLGTFNSTFFTNGLVARMRQINPTITAANVQVRYSGSDLGMAAPAPAKVGDPNPMDISPLITVSLGGGTAATRLKFRPITSLLFIEMNMPTFSTTLTAEDVSGDYSN